MKSLAKLISICAACLLLVGGHTKLLADSHIWFFHPTNGETRYIDPNHTTLDVFWAINWVPIGPPGYYDWKTKVKIDNGGWMENIFSATITLGPGTHYFFAELWEMNIGGSWFQTGTDNISMTIVSQFNVTFKNHFPPQQNGTNGQVKIGDWGSRNIVTSPYTQVLPIPQYSTRVMEAFNQNYQAPNEANYFRVYRDWSKNGAPWTSTNPVESVQPVTGPTDYRANFNRQFNVNVSAAGYIEPGSGATYKVNNTNVGSTWSGTFTENVSSSITLEAVPPNSEWFFVQWSDGDTHNPRSLVPIDHITDLHAIFKMHLGSSLSSATGTNSQRLVAGIEGVPDRYYMAYPSVGELWRTQSLDAGATWETDTKFTNSSGTTSAPSVALWREQLDPPIMHLFTAYRQQVGNNYEIRFTDALRTPLASETINQVDIPTTIDTRPVIALWDAKGLKTLLAFWQGTYGIHYNYAEQNGSSWEWLGEEYGGLAANTRNPSISSPDLTVQTPNWYLTYDNGNNVLMSDYSGTFYDTSIPASITPISYSSQVCADNRDGEQVHVVWEAYGDDEVERRYVMYQQWSGTRWEDAHVFTSGIDYYRPTVSSLSNGDIVWAWDDGANTYKAVHPIDDDNWSVVEFLSNTTQPNLVASASEGPIGSTRFVSTSTSGAPYRLTFGAETRDGPQSLTLQEQYSRRVVVARKPPQRPGRFGHSMSSDEQYDGDSLCYVSVELLPIILKMRDGSAVPVEFVSVGDSTMDERSIWESLRSQTVALPSGIDSIIITGETDALSPHRLAGVELGLSFDLVDADQGTVLKRIGTELVFNSSGRGSLIRGEKLSGVAGRRVFIRPSIRGFVGRSTNLVSTLVHVHTLLMDSTSNPASPLAKVGETAAALPTAFALHQNYPNPFNPATEIRFDVPNASNVSLIVYDVLGREVAVLANGYREAGYHSTTWNASAQSSGVYFARFNVTNGEGKIAYSKVNKLALMK